MTERLPYSLGCSGWNVRECSGTFLQASDAQTDPLGAYSSVFNTVEDDSFLDGIPPLDVVRRWVDESAEGFAFCIRLPREIAHAPRLVAGGSVYELLIERLEILNDADHLGPSILQLRESFDPSRLDELFSFFENWPDHLPLAVEVRHEAFFRPGRARSRFYAGLRGAEVDRVIFDGRAMLDGTSSDTTKEKSQAGELGMPDEWTVTGMQPVVRFAGGNSIEKVKPWQSEAARIVAAWIREGRRPYVFMQTPDAAFATLLCRRFHALVREWIPEMQNLNFPEMAPKLRLLEDG